MRLHQWSAVLDLEAGARGLSSGCYKGQRPCVLVRLAGLGATGLDRWGSRSRLGQPGPGSGVRLAPARGPSPNRAACQCASNLIPLLAGRASTCRTSFKFSVLLRIRVGGVGPASAASLSLGGPAPLYRVTRNLPLNDSRRAGP